MSDPLERQVDFFLSKIKEECDEDTVSGLSEAIGVIIEPIVMDRSPYSMADVMMALAICVSAAMPKNRQGSLVMRRAFAMLVDEVHDKGRKS